MFDLRKVLGHRVPARQGAVRAPWWFGLCNTTC